MSSLALRGNKHVRQSHQSPGCPLHQTSWNGCGQSGGPSGQRHALGFLAFSNRESLPYSEVQLSSGSSTGQPHSAKAYPRETLFGWGQTFPGSNTGPHLSGPSPHPIPGSPESSTRSTLLVCCRNSVIKEGPGQTSADGTEKDRLSGFRVHRP